MSSMILAAEELNLPNPFAVKIKGKKVEISEKEGIIIITPVQSAISTAKGMFKGSNFGTDLIMKQKEIEKRLEYGE